MTPTNTLIPTYTAPPTSTFQPTSTPQPTSTITPSPTSTLTFTPTATQDERVFTGDVKDLLCQKEDLPGARGDYYLPKNMLSPETNNEVIQTYLDSEKGREYVDATGRLDGWSVFYRAVDSSNTPIFIYCHINQFETIEGASEAITYPIWGWDELFNIEYTPAVTERVIGSNLIVRYVDENNPFEKRLYRRYDVIFQYRNLIGFVKIYDRTNPASPNQGLDVVLDIAEKIFSRMNSASLSSPIDLNGN
jgi:hypothetical protein